MRHLIQKWYDGKTITQEFDEDNTYIYPYVYQERHWTANLAHWLADISISDWKWIIGTPLTIISIIVTIIALI